MRKIIMLYIAAAFILGFDLISCELLHPVQPTQSPTKIENKNKYEQSAPLSPTSQQENQASARPEYNKHLPLLSSKCSPEIWRILTPDIFTRPDPVHYLLTETINLPHAFTFSLRYCLTDDKFPAQYIPYANVLLYLSYCQDVLKYTTIQIKKIQKSALSRYADLPLEVHSAEFFGLFSLDLFLDANPPVQVMNKLIDVMDLPRDRKTDLVKLFKKVMHPQLLHEYYEYAPELLIVIQENHILSRLKGSVDLLKEYLTKNSPSNPI